MYYIFLFLYVGHKQTGKGKNNFWKMLKSLQISKRMGLKDLLRLLYLSLLMSVKERQTYSTFYVSAFVF